MRLNQISDNKGARKTRVRVGRGPGSGKGTTAGRGDKGQKSRSGVAIKGFEGGQMPIYRRLPKRGFKNAFRKVFTTVNIRDLAVFDDGAVVDLDAVITSGLVSLNTRNFKVLGGGDLTKKLTVRAQKFSKSAAQKIQDAGGSVVVLDRRGREVAGEGEEGGASNQ